MTKMTIHKSAPVRSVARARHIAPKRLRGIRQGRAETGLEELFRELRTWDELSAESMRTHGF